jgi:hypothetical protein
MLKDGLYKVSFQTPLGAGAGVVVLSGGHMRGGDSAIYYAGTYTQDDNRFSASVATARHSAGLPSVFGIDTAHISLRGSIDGDSATAQGTAVEAPGVTFQVILTRLAV